MSSGIILGYAGINMLLMFTNRYVKAMAWLNYAKHMEWDGLISYFILYERCVYEYERF